MVPSTLIETKLGISPLQMVAHTLKHPLAVLKANLQILQNSPQEDVRTLCLRQVDRMNQFIGKILIPGQKNGTRASIFNLNDLLQEVIEFTRPSCESQSIHIEALFSPLPDFQGNKEALFHAFLNLFTNALEACSDYAFISIKTETRGNHVMVALQDHGTGMDREILENLSSPYYTTKQNGNGLGLMIAREVIQNHGGTVEIMSEQGLGTTIWVTLPIDPIHPEGTEP